MTVSSGVATKTARRPGSMVLRLVRLVGVIYLCWVVVLSGCQTRLVFPRDAAGPALPEAAIPRGVERLWVTASDGSRVEAWYFAARGAAASARSPLAVLFHGNAELIDHFDEYADWYLARGFAVLIPEYRGYGRSGGTPSEKAITADAVAFYDLVIARPEIDPARVAYHGRSLGSAVAVQVAARRAPAVLILESPFTSITAFAARFLVPGFAVKDPFRSDRVLPTLGKPLLILHSREDEIIPVSHGRRLAAATAGSKLVELTGGHNSGLSRQPAYWEAVEGFLRENAVLVGR